MLHSATGFTGGLSIYQDGANPIAFWINATERMRITSAGNVGIGTTAPTARLHVAAPGALSTDIALRVRNSADTTDLLSIAGNGNSVINGSLRIVSTPSVGNVIRPDDAGAAFQFGNGNNTSYGEFRFKDAGGTDLARLSSTGNLGIGTATPSQKLEVIGNAIFRSTNRIDINTAQTAVVGVLAGTSLGTYGNFSLISSSGLAGESTDISYWNGGTYYPAFRISNVASGFSNLLLMKDGGNVGIGMTPTAKLAIKAPGALSTDIALRVRNSADSLNLMFVNGLGQTAIGQGTATLTNMLTVQDVYSTSVGIELRSDQNPRVGSTFNTSRILSGYSSGTASFLDLQYAGGAYPYTYTTGLRLNSLGNILINTTTDVASSKLTIESTTQGVLFPRMTTTQKNAIATPATGLVVFDTTLNKLCVRGASSWETITSI
jgi:hypothetical protein